MNEATPPDTPYALLGGAGPVGALAERFYALIDSDPAYAELRAAHGPDLAPIAASLAGFLTAWLGGPRDWFVERPGTCIMRMHRALAFPPALGAQWAAAMLDAIRAEPAFDSDLGRQVGETLRRMALAMVTPLPPGPGAP